MEKKYLNVLLLCLVLFGSINYQAKAADQARSYAITHWGNCGGSTRVWWDDMCMAWRKRMDSKGWNVWWNNFHLVKISKFTDPVYAAWGKDNGWSGIDKGHASLICTHGGHNSNGWYGVMHTQENGECNLNVNQMKIGPASGGRMRFYHMSSCNSVRWNLKTKWFGPASGKVHVITGFHGYMYIGRKYVGEYRDLAKYGYTSKGVGKVWMDKMHHVDHWYNAWKTVCPISLGFGNTASAASNAQNERYTSRWSNKTPYWMNYRWKSKCNPNGGPKLPK
ncbi:MAG: hypothetical protein ISR65_09595 [Bacteriovoracaceae bacterium]|nr:hypothetical protein [Bacteriovoracaceae bacterium]